MKPTVLTRDKFLALLDDLRARVAEGDSFGGFLEYEAADEPHTYEVTAAYRRGNRHHGQGFMRMVGEVA